MSHRALYQALRTALADPPLGTLTSAASHIWGEKYHPWQYDKCAACKPRNLTAAELLAVVMAQIAQEPNLACKWQLGS